MTPHSPLLRVVPVVWVAAACALVSLPGETAGGGGLPAAPQPAKQPAAKTAKLVNVATDATDPGNLEEAEPSIAVNPKNPLEIAIVTLSEGWDPEAANPRSEDMAPVWKTKDGGTTWRKVRQIPCPRLGVGGPADQKVAYDSEGYLVVAVMLQGTKAPRCYLGRQTGNDGDAPLTYGVAFGFDQPLVDAERVARATGAGAVYCSFLEYRERDTYRAGAIATLDRGKTSTNRLPGDTAKYTNGTARLAAAPDNRAYLLYKTQEGNRAKGFEDASFWVCCSGNSGTDWTKPVCVHAQAPVRTLHTTNKAYPFGDPKKGKTAWACNSDAWLAVHATDGTVYVAYVNKDASAFAQIFVVSSTDKGKTWSQPVRVTDGSNHSGFPALAVAGTGAVGLLYVDYDDTKAKTSFRHRLARSFDGGLTWTDQILQELDPNPLLNAVGNSLWADYQGLTAHGETFYGVFIGESTGRTVRQLDPVFFTETAKK
jgi:hypothetical protein